MAGSATRFEMALMPWYKCPDPDCGHRWRGRGRKPGGEVYCPKCGALAYTYAKTKATRR